MDSGALMTSCPLDLSDEEDFSSRGHPISVEPSSTLHELQPNVRIRVGTSIMAAAPDRATIGWLAGPIRPGPGAPFPRWPVIIARVCAPTWAALLMSGLSGRPQDCCNGQDS